MINEEQRPMLRFLAILSIASVAGLQAWMILQQLRRRRGGAERPQVEVIQ